MNTSKFGEIPTRILSARITFANGLYAVADGAGHVVVYRDAPAEGATSVAREKVLCLNAETLELLASLAVQRAHGG